ncbi:MAG: thermonuclease family protein [Acidimicrobiales bacterium]
MELHFGELTERVRLLGVDAPESVSPSVPEQCFGAEASLALAELLPPGTVVTVTRDIEARDRYDRLLLYLHRSNDGLFVNRWLIDSGLADAVAYEPNTAHRTEFDRARRQAEAGGIGLWGRCDGPDQPLL